MFKQTYGFDTDLLKFGEPIKITDNEPNERPRNMFKITMDLDGMDYDWENKAGTYLIVEASSTVLRLMSMNGEIVKLPIRHFLGDDPRMIAYLHNGWKGVTYKR